MKHFTGMEYLEIDIANNFGAGLDKQNWEDRIYWTRSNKHKLLDYTEEANKQFLYYKAVRAYEDALASKEIGHIMYLDATASGPQILSILSGDTTGAKATNVIFEDKIQDIYQSVADTINKLCPEELVTRKQIKKPVMTFFYNKQSPDGLTERQEEAFSLVIQNCFNGLLAIKSLFNMAWDYTGIDHTWTLPDGHIAYVPVTDIVNKIVEVDELDHASFTYRYETQSTSDWYGPLCPNIIQSIDAWILRQMVRKCNLCEIPLVTVHDAFGSHPNFMNQIRQFYIDTMVELSESNLLYTILRELGITKVPEFPKLTNQIKESEYMLS